MVATVGTVASNAGTDVTSLTVTVSGASTGDGCAILASWYLGPGDAFRTISSASCDTGETVNIVGSHIEDAGFWRNQILVIDRFTAGGDKTITLTLSGQSNSVALRAQRFNGQIESGSARGGAAQSAATSNTAQTSVTRTTANSAVLIFGTTSLTAAVLTARTGWTEITVADSASRQIFGAYIPDAGGSTGAYTAGFDWIDTAYWTVSAVEILPGASAVLSPVFMSMGVFR